MNELAIGLELLGFGFIVWMFIKGCLAFEEWFNQLTWTYFTNKVKEPEEPEEKVILTVRVITYKEVKHDKTK